MARPPSPPGTAVRCGAARFGSDQKDGGAKERRGERPASRRLQVVACTGVGRYQRRDADGCRRVVEAQAGVGRKRRGGNALRQATVDPAAIALQRTGRWRRLLDAAAHARHPHGRLGADPHHAAAGVANARTRTSRTAMERWRTRMTETRSAGARRDEGEGGSLRLASAAGDRMIRRLAVSVPRRKSAHFRRNRAADGVDGA